MGPRSSSDVTADGQTWPASLSGRVSTSTARKPSSGAQPRIARATGVAPKTTNVGAGAGRRLAAELDHRSEHDLFAAGEPLGQLFFDARHGLSKVRAAKR